MGGDPRMALLAALQQARAGGPPNMGAMPEPPGRSAVPPLAPPTPRGQPMHETSLALQALHAAIVAEPEPEDKHALAQALQIVLRVQAKNAKEAGPGTGRPPTQGY